MADSVPDPGGQARALSGSERGEEHVEAERGGGVNGERETGAGEADFVLSSASVEYHPDVPEGQTAEDSKLPSDDDHNALPPEKKKPGRKKKRTGYVRKNSKKALASDAELKKEGEISKRTPAKKRSKVASDPLPPTTPQCENPAVPEIPELTPGGRPKRRAAKAALEYLHTITKDLERPDEPSRDNQDDSPVQPSSLTKSKPSGKGRGRKRKKIGEDSDASEDANFDPGDHEELESEEDKDEDECEDPEITPCKSKGRGYNGLSNVAMLPVWTLFRNTKVFREKHCSPWVFSEWIPSMSDWHRLSVSEAEKYLPKEEESVSFALSREGIKGQSTPQKMKRFEASPPHPERWDSLFFVGGPVWAMEWCPCPDGAADTQYAAIYCNKGMDDRHKINALHTEQTLLQLWNLGKLQMSRPATTPHLAYAVAVEDGCIWNIKWCPAGAWELSTTKRKAPLMPRLGLIATAFSNGTIGIYSLPHPEALMAQNPATGETSQAPLIYRVRRIMTLKLGSSHADHNSQSGQCFALDWLPVKPHNILAAGFCDGMVALWNLSSKSSLQKVRNPDRSVCLYPYHCFLAHDNFIRSLSWCRASSELIVTVGDDRMAKLWNVSKTHTPLKVIKRFLPTEVAWPIFWPGVLLTQESCYAALGQQGLYYLDSGYFGHKAHFVCTRKATVWSFSMSDWINSCVMGDNIGDLVCSLLCDPNANFSNCKRNRFPLYRTEMVQYEPGQRLGAAEEEGEEEGEASIPHQEPLTYRGATRKYYLHFQDIDLRSFVGYRSKPLVKQVHYSETKGTFFSDKMPLNALYKARFNPNMDSCFWVLSGGQSGLVRVHCVSGLNGPITHKLIREAQTQFNGMFHSEENDTDANAVHHYTADMVQVQ